MNTREPLRCKKCGGLWRECFGCSQWRPGPEFEALIARRGVSPEFNPLEPLPAVRRKRTARVNRSLQPGRQRHRRNRQSFYQRPCLQCGRMNLTDDPDQKFCNDGCEGRYRAAMDYSRRMAL